MIYLLAYLLLEPVKRVLSAFLYPVAYALRGWARFEICVIWDGYLYEPCLLPVWLFLDDSAALEFKKEYANNPKYYPAWLWKYGGDFWLSYWWAAIRNSMVNWNNANAYVMGEYKTWTSRTSWPAVLGEKGFYEVREFASGRRRPYCEFYVFGRWNQVGWIKKGRFEIDVMKAK